MESLKISGMSCGHCVQAVKQALENVEGLKNVEVDLETGEARFEQEKPVDMEVVKKAVQDAGYGVD